MTAAPDSRPLDERLKAAIAELCDASDEEARESEFVLDRPYALDSILRTWGAIEPHDERWRAASALFMLDQPGVLSANSPAVASIRLAAQRLLIGALDIDADLGEDDIRWLHMRQLRLVIDALPALYGALETELETGEVS